MILKAVMDEFKNLPKEELIKRLEVLSSNLSLLTQEYNKLIRNLTVERLSFLFKILENKENFDSDFIIDTVDEIKRLLIIKEENNEA